MSSDYVRIATLSDPHGGKDDDDPFAKFYHFRDWANYKNADVAVINGDFWHDQQQKRIERRLREGEARLVEWADADDRRYLRLLVTVQQAGGVKGLQAQIDELDDNEIRKELEFKIKQWNKYEPELEQVAKKYKSLVAFNDKWTEDDIDKEIEKMERDAGYRWRKLDSILGEMNAEVYVTTGNWETDIDRAQMERLEHAQILDGKVAECKGFRFGGAPATYEAVSMLPQDRFYRWMEEWHDPAMGATQDGLGREINNLVETLQRQGKLRDVDKQLLDEYNIVPRGVLELLYQDNKTMQSYIGEDVDAFFFHKGVGDAAGQRSKKKNGASKEWVNFGWGVGAQEVVKEQLARGRNITTFGGHLHGKEGHAFKQEQFFAAPRRDGRIGLHKAEHDSIMTTDKVFAISDFKRQETGWNLANNEFFQFDKRVK